MKIKEVSCEQFAGIRNKEVRFEDGLNVIYGKNESGKSTLISLIYRTLFQNTKMDRRSSDSSFLKLYFPADVKQGDKGDCIDGTVKFETSNGEYKITREWNGKSGNSKLITPTAKITLEENINEKIKEELVYGKGIYDEIVFASQKNSDNVLKALFDETESKSNSADIKMEIATIVTKAVLESDGISIERLESAINEKIANASGHWDFEYDRPEKNRGIDNPWQKNVGSILASYYEMKEEEKKIEDAGNLEKEIDSVSGEIKILKEAAERAKTEKAELEAFVIDLKNKNNIEQVSESLNRELRDCKAIQEDWPKSESTFNNATELKIKLQNAQIRELYQKALEYKKQIEAFEEIINRLGEIRFDDKVRAETLDRERQILESQLSGVNLSAKIKLMDDIDVKVIADSNGKELDISSGEFEITEAVSINVPEIMELQLAPKGINPDEVTGNLASVKEELEALLEKYRVTDVKQLTDNYSRLQNAIKDRQREQDLLDNLLGDKTMEQMEKADRSITQVTGEVNDVTAEINKLIAEISKLCGSRPIDAYIGGLESTITGYKDKYDSQHNLKKHIDDLVKKIDGNNKKLESLNNIPEKYQDIDPDMEIGRLDEIIENAKLSEKRDRLSKLEERLDFLGYTTDEMIEEMEKKKKIFEDEKAAYGHWKNIRKAFNAVKSSSFDHPMEDIAQHFRKYLSLISNDGIALDEMDDKLNVRIYSNNNLLDYNILSEGTKDTIALAFRLSVLEHLFPQGNGLAVFDDAFNDMDAERRMQACRLIKQFAKKNQVLFVTCDEEYMDMLHGNRIYM